MTEPQGGSTKTHYLALFDELIAAPDSEARGVIFARFKAERALLPPTSLPTMPPFNNGRRESLTELRPRHLHMIEEYGFEEHGYDRSATRAYFLENYNKLFGRLRPKALEVPSNQFWKEFIILRLLDLIEGRRAEYVQERGGALRATNIGGTQDHTPWRSKRVEYSERARARAASLGFKPNYIDRLSPKQSTNQPTAGSNRGLMTATGESDTLSRRRSTYRKQE